MAEIEPCPHRCDAPGIHGHGTDRRYHPNPDPPVNRFCEVPHCEERECPVLHPSDKVPTPGGFDAALYAAFVAGVKARHAAGGEMRMLATPEEFDKWRSQWFGEWVR